MVRCLARVKVEKPRCLASMSVVLWAGTLAITEAKKRNMKEESVQMKNLED